ncbi:putative transcriptional regulator YdeE [Orbus hercynius]|uniref:Putative transcriptional regulator YdeE n=1 Tax=Orbus hercynius TaxID=593135 RepID=A0A495RHZ6_9GAMM|nr:effector binding domain-containing protein [Orbus hercynius]RKS87153.1 putative transcriptional regulator YdeE [Orbus hercynius]
MFFAVNSVRTNNFTDENMIDKIKALWQEAQTKITNDTGCVYGIYHHYQNDYRGDYTLSIAVDHPIDHFSALITPNPIDNYVVFAVNDDHEDKIYQTWQHIWGLEQEGKLLRAYDVDFEKYYPDGRVEIYISILN